MVNLLECRAFRLNLGSLAALALSLPWFWGCTGATQQKREDFTAKPSLWAQVSVQPQGETTWHAISPKDAMHSGDRFNVMATTQQPGYFYVVLALPDHSLDVLAPGQGEQPTPIGPGSVVYAPGPGEDKSWALDEHTGEEHLYVVTAARPLGPGELKAELASISPTPLSSGRDPPPVADSRNRTGQTRSALVAAQTNHNGVAVVHFAFQHD